MWGNMVSILANLKDSTLEYKFYQGCVDVWEVEANCSVKPRIPAWNISIARWLKLTVFVPLNEAKVKKDIGVFLTFLFSAFWHGLFPSYYVAFFIACLLDFLGK